MTWDPAVYQDDPNKTIEENAVAKLEAMAAAYQTQLRTKVDPLLTVEAQTGGLVFSNVKDLSFSVESFQAVKTGSSPLQTAEVGVIDPPFSDVYYANTDGGQLVIGALRGDVPERDIKNSFVVFADAEELVPEPAVKTLQGLVDRINAKQAQTHVAASIDENGDLKLSTTDLKGVSAISIGPGKSVADGSFVSNALGLVPQDYDVSKRLASLLAEKPYMNDIRVSFGSYQVMAQDGTTSTHFGDPAMLSQIGLRTAAYIEGTS